ncbi:MAG: hypothetical protein P8130_03120 [Deltaproteobacteria bacterium]
MKIGHWIIVMLLVGVAGFAFGYKVSAHTGSEPGYFDAVEAAGYGGEGGEKIEGLNKEQQEYYKSLMQDDE